jgi:hypothetical protein
LAIWYLCLHLGFAGRPRDRPVCGTASSGEYSCAVDIEAAGDRAGDLAQAFVELAGALANGYDVVDLLDHRARWPVSWPRSARASPLRHSRPSSGWWSV